MIDPILSLAISSQAAKGTYALLLGSGVSRGAHILTGHEITLDLISKLAALQNVETHGDPESWYVETYRREPNYPEILSEVAQTATARQQLLRGYFEPSEDERAEGIKLPTQAHKAIAELVRRGFIRVIVTTNFDRLLEQALESQGVIPTVISTPDAARGATPLIHNACTILKVHGDYLDTRIRNSASEVAEYDEEVDDLLDRIFDEFGLVVCGWSAEWDPALRSALERCPTHRFPAYWTGLRELQGHAQTLSTLRRARFIRIDDAASFFLQWLEKISALDSIEESPLTTHEFIASVKSYVTEDRHKVRLYDLLLSESQRIAKDVLETSVTGSVDREPFLRRVIHYENLSLKLRSAFSVGCLWDDYERNLWNDCLSVLGMVHSASGVEPWIQLQKYPALLLLYSGGITALFGQKYRILRSLLQDARIAYHTDRVGPAVVWLDPYYVMDIDRGRLLPGFERHYLPLSEYLRQFLANDVGQFLPTSADYYKAFDRFEYLFGLLSHIQREVMGLAGGFVGAYCFHYYREPQIENQVGSEIERLGADWPPLKEGLFSGSPEELATKKRAFDEYVDSMRRERW
jgi:hypothetical protein